MSTKTLPRTQYFTLADGRKAAYMEYGDPDGAPAFILHGTPGNRAHQNPIADAILDAGVRAIALDRPGFGKSDPKPGMSFTSYADDLIEMADQLGWDTFGVMGQSGGGGYTTAAAAAYPDRVSRAVLVCGMHPITTEAEMADIATAGQAMYKIAGKSPKLLYPQMWIMRLAAKRFPKLMDKMNSFVPEADAKAIEPHKEALAEVIVDALQQGPRYAAEELARYVEPYDFDLSAITVPFTFLHGDADVNVPLAIAQRIAAQVPNCTMQVFEGEAHMFMLTHPLACYQALAGK